ncbi:MAG TPA: hypothetical protein VFZ52_11305 [Chryseolinea sp.]
MKPAAFFSEDIDIVFEKSLFGVEDGHDWVDHNRKVIRSHPLHRVGVRMNRLAWILDAPPFLRQK